MVYRVYTGLYAPPTMVYRVYTGLYASLYPPGYTYSTTLSGMVNVPVVLLSAGMRPWALSGRKVWVGGAESLSGP